MVDVIKRGRVPLPDDVFRVTCTHCGSLLEFKRREAKLIFDQREGDYYQLRCPECARHTTIATEIFERMHRRRPATETQE